MSRNSITSNAIRGGVAGAIATVGMTAVMVLMHRRLPRRERYGLPPEQIVDDLLDRADASGELSEGQFKTLSMAAHHGYGTAMGAAYGIVAPHVRADPLTSGVCFGIFVWALSYLGWLPAMRMRASATREPAGRNVLTIATHLVWGAATGLLMAQRKMIPLDHDEEASPAAEFSAAGSRRPFGGMPVDLGTLVGDHPVQAGNDLQRLGNR